MRSAHRRGNRVLTALLCSALAVGGLTVTPAAASSAGAFAAGSLSSSWRDDDRRRSDDKVLMFAADGLRQDIVERYVREDWRAFQGFADLLRRGAKADGDGMLTQAPPNTGAGWYTMATGAWPGRARVDEQHVPRQRPAVRQPHGRLRPGRAAGRDDRPVRRAGRQEGHPDGVGRRPNRRHRRSDRRLPAVPVRPRRHHELRRRRRPAGVDQQLRPAVRPPADSRQAPSRRRPRPRPPAGPTCRVAQPGAGDADAGPRLRGRQVRAERLHLRQHRRPDHELRPGAVLADQVRSRSEVADLAEGELRRRQGHRSNGGRPSARRNDRRHARQGRGTERRRHRRSGCSTPP